MRVLKYITCQFVMLFSVICLSGEIVYQDYLEESKLLSSLDLEVNAMVNTAFDWNYFFESNSLAVALKIKYGMEEGTNVVFRPIVARYDFKSVRVPVSKSIRRADRCYRHLAPIGFCMVGLDSFLFSHGQRPDPKTTFMCLSDSAQRVVDITRDIDGMFLNGVLSASERAVFPDGDGFAFQCVGNADGWGLLLWNGEKGVMRPMASRLRGYVCLSGGRVLLDSPNVRTAASQYQGEMIAHCYRVLSCRDANAEPNVYADWDASLSNKIISLCKNASDDYDWSIALHEMKGMYSQNERGHEFAEGNGVLYDFFGGEIFRLRRNDSGWQVFNLREYLGEEIGMANQAMEMTVLHRGSASWYYAYLFDCGNFGRDSTQRYRLKIVEMPREGADAFVWSFPEFKTAKKLTTDLSRSPGVVHKLPDDSWVFLSSTMTYTNDAIFVQRMIGSRERIEPIFKPIFNH